MNTAPKLLPCPFCGNDVNDDEGCFPVKRERSRWEVRCGNPSCFAHEASDDTQEAAIARWNNRLAPPSGEGVDAFSVMRSAFVTSESCGPEGDYRLVFRFRSLEALQQAHREWVTTQQSAPVDGDALMEGWHSAVDDAGEIFTNYDTANREAIRSRASRVVTWLKAQAGELPELIDALIQAAADDMDNGREEYGPRTKEIRAMLIGRFAGGVTVDDATIDDVAFALSHADSNAYSHDHYRDLARAALVAALGAK